MAEVLMVLANLINDLHDFIVSAFGILGISVSDKDLHFGLIGFIGLVLFFVVDAMFKQISRWNISVLSFVYTFTVLVVLVFGLEIQQKITGRGEMDFDDIVAGLWGFVVMFGGLLAVKGLVYSIRRLWGK
ncbi:MAG: hypothetical protein FH756_10045 [Firmicutes bacterium]|nr:hypothetical protein [Bacillota bacterium]